MVMREATRCPTCRRPALMRRRGQGAISVAGLAAAAAEETETMDVAPPPGTGGMLRRWAVRDNVTDAFTEDEDDEDSVLEGWIPQQADAGIAPATSSRPRRPRTQEFEVLIEKEGEELGLDVLQHDWETLLITRIKEGPLRLWNQRHPQHGIRHGDRIVEVNGQRGNSELLIATIRSEWSLRMVIRRLVEFGVSVQRPNGHRLGLDVMQQLRSLRVLQVREGPFRRWNAGVTFDFQVQPTDYIVEVNGVHGNSASLLQEIQDSESPQLQLVLVRRRAAELSAPRPEPEVPPVSRGLPPQRGCGHRTQPAMRGSEASCTCGGSGRLL